MISNFLFDSLKPYWKLVLGQVSVAIIWAIDFSLKPYGIKLIVDVIPNVLESHSFDILIKRIAFYFSIVIFTLLISRFHEWIILSLHPNLIKHISTSLMRYIMDHSHNFFYDQFSGSIASKVNDIANGVSNILNTLINQFISQILALLFAIYAIYTVHTKLAVVLVIWIVIFLGFSLKFSKKGALLSKNTAQKRSDVVGYTVDVLNNMFNVRVFAAKNFEINNLHDFYQKFVNAQQNRDWFFMKVHTMQEISFIVYQVSCFWWLIEGMNSGNISSGDFVFIMMLNIAVVNSVYSMSRDLRDFAESFGNVIHGIEIFYSYSGNQSKDIKKAIVVNSGKISFINVSFAYPNSKQIFNKLSITILSGQKIGIVGYSGGGKTTFINLILRLFDINGGKILIDNYDISKFSQYSLYKFIGIIPQDILLFNRNILENIRYGRLDASDAEIIEAAKKAHIHEFITRLPDKYSTLVGERGIKLSGGERQRIAIARTFLKNAPIILLDEATNQLDSITEKLIQESIINLIQYKTAIVIAHRLSTLLKMDRILVFDNGEIIQDGTHEELVKVKGLYRNLWSNQISGILPDRMNK
jgi:ATP-binding cassette subfamily B protein